MKLNELVEGDRFVDSQQVENYYEVRKGGKIFDCFWVDGKLIEEELTEIYIKHFKTIKTWIKI